MASYNIVQITGRGTDSNSTKPTRTNPTSTNPASALALATWAAPPAGHSNQNTWDWKVLLPQVATSNPIRMDLVNKWLPCLSPEKTIGCWLKVERLRKYEPNFQHLGWAELLLIDAEPELVELGITSKGARDKFLNLFHHIRGFLRTEPTPSARVQSLKDRMADIVWDS